MTTARAISPLPTRSEDTLLSGNGQLYFSTGSLGVVVASHEERSALAPEKQSSKSQKTVDFWHNFLRFSWQCRISQSRA
ncbi:hypothetical protein [Ktedonospora formicarum]|uniref:hypothetical protein n=1 Tax=Ktedonospora formicarum TaxID=2778364 RepID=UPI001C6891C9|nr:hypothetical protein [Ktedonospora formicarum]